MGIGDKLLDKNYEPSSQPTNRIESPFFKKIIKCPVNFTEDIIEYVESPEFLGMTLRPLQRKFLEELFYVNPDGSYKYEQGVMCCGMRGGKSHSIKEQILMYDGTLKEIGKIQIGDIVMGPDSTPRKVLNTSRGESEMFEIKQSCADTYIINDAHILSLKKAQSVNCSLGKNRKSNVRYGNEPDIVNIPIKEYLKKSKKWKYFFRGYKAGLIKFEEQPISIDPYLVGQWLADGHATELRITKTDADLKEWIYKFAKENDLIVKEYQKKNTIAKDFYFDKSNGNSNKIWNEFKKLNLPDNKHIPQCYISNSKEIRLELLAALIDGDGHHRLNRHGYDIAFSNETLAMDTKRLADTLGYRTHIQKKKTSCKNKETGYNFEGEAWRLSIYGNVWEIPCKVKRKQYVHNGKRTNKEEGLSSLKVTSIGWGKYAGIGVDGDNLYCLADGTVTHNSWTAAFITTFMTQLMLKYDNPAQEFGQAPGTRITGQIIASSEVQAKETAYAAVESILDYGHWWQKYIAYLKEREETEGKHTLYQELKLAREFPEKNVAVLSLHSNSAALAGKTSYCVVLDELSRFDVADGMVQSRTQKSTANAVYDTVARACSSLKQISKVVTISSPMYEDDYTMRLLCMAKDCWVGEMSPIIDALRNKTVTKVPTLYGMHATTFELNPKTEENPGGFVRGEDFESARLQNPEAYNRDYLACPPSTVNPFFEFPEKIDRVVIDREKKVAFSDKMIEESIQTANGIEMRMYIGKNIMPLKPDKMNKYYICVDQGEKRDHFALAMGHVESMPIDVTNDKGDIEKASRLKIIIDFVTGWIPDKQNRITVSFANVEEVIKVLCQSFHVGVVTYDQWSSAESIQRLFSEGVNTQQLGATLSMYETFKQLIYQGQLELPKHEILLKELKQLTLIKGKKLDHPSSGSKDYSDAVCRVCWLCYEDYIMETVHGQHMLPYKQNLPTLRSVASAYEIMRQNDMNPHGAIWNQSQSGQGVFGDTFIVRTNVIPNIKGN